MDETNSYSSLLDTPNSSLILKGPYHLNKFFDIWKYHLAECYAQAEKFNFDSFHLQISWLSWKYQSKGIWEMVSESP